jgi:hypothetical protein
MATARIIRYGTIVNIRIVALRIGVRPLREKGP